MQISQSPEQSLAGSDVRVRRARWRVVDIRSYSRCRVLTLMRLAPPDVGTERRVLDPFDTIEVLRRTDTPRVVGRTAWRRVCRKLIAGCVPAAGLREARPAEIELMAHQLEPALAVLRGLGARVLLADEVGLGKTIQAGLILAELHARGWIDRTLVLTPAGLRDQWASELATRFRIDAASADARTLRRLASALPVGVNPWTTLTTAVASTDYVKRVEVLAAAAAARWDLLIVDEAHGVAGDTDRHDAVRLLAARASYVLLLTATPHNGDERAFKSLCHLGSHGDPLLVFRRTRADVRIDAQRRVRIVRVDPTAWEARMYAALRRYSDAIGAEHGAAWLALSVLHKRAFSSAWSLARSIERRIAVLEAQEAASRPDDATQIALPLEDPLGETTADDEPPAWPAELALSDRRRELVLLTSLADACKQAETAGERKIAILRRLLRRANESAIVFTEYRDTLLHLQRSLSDVSVEVLHGGQTREERAAVLDAFARSNRSILIATDAGGEGLNLHHACRLVINLELPWNPMRLEQRIGRVDRIGQRRRVHAWNLVASGTGEARILDRLRARIARARVGVGAPNPLGVDEERAIARYAIRREQEDSDGEFGVGADAGVCPGADTWVGPYKGTELTTADLRAEATSEVERLQRARAVWPGRDHHTDLLQPADRPLIMRSRTRLRRLLGTGGLLIFRAAWENELGCLVDSSIVAVVVRRIRRHTTHAELTATVRELTCVLRDRVGSETREWRRLSDSRLRAAVGLRLARERAIAAENRACRAAFQPGLFDRRAERVERERTQSRADANQRLHDRIALVERIGNISPRSPALMLAILP